jgi:hypothetical protein
MNLRPYRTTQAPLVPLWPIGRHPAAIVCAITDAFSKISGLNAGVRP